MALKLSWLALCASVVLAVGLADPTPPQHLARQNFDAKQLNESQPTSVSSTPIKHGQVAQRPAPDLPSDIVALDFPFNTSDIDQLVGTGSIQIGHPHGGLLRLTLRDVRHRHATRIIRFLSDNLPGVITQRGDTFIGTLATSRGTYNLSSQPSSQTRPDRPASRLIDQHQLDLRVVPQQPDYKRAPLAVL